MYKSRNKVKKHFQMATFLGINFGSKFPTTHKYEADQQNLISDYKRYNEYSNSEIYQRYIELDKITHTGDFEKRVEKLKTEKFSDTEAYHKHKNHLALKKSKDIKSFLKFIQSGKEKTLGEYQLSANYIEFKELEQIINSGEFKKAQQQKGFKKTDEYKQLVEFKRLKKSTEVKYVTKILKSSEYHSYNQIKDSSRLDEFTKLDAYVNSPEFKELKTFLEDKKRFFKSEEHKLLHEYEEIKKSDDQIWYEKIKKQNLFTEVNKWELTFNDDFDQNKVDPSKWMKGYYWGKALTKGNYALGSEKQLFADNNIEVRDSIAKIKTQKETLEGNLWDKTLGFKKASFNYSSGLLNTGHSFRQQYGKFEIKAKLKTANQVNHALWMVGERMSPQITILKTGTKSNKQFKAGSISMAGNQVKDSTSIINAVNLNNDFHVFTLEWMPNKITWKINGVVVHEQNSDVPDFPMYINMSTHINQDINGQSLPSSIDIDWVRCYKLKEL